MIPRRRRSGGHGSNRGSASPALRRCSQPSCCRRRKLAAGVGLGAFWAGGLGLLRLRSPWLSATVHHICNVAAVVAGHLTGRDRF